MTVRVHEIAEDDRVVVLGVTLDASSAAALEAAREDALLFVDAGAPVDVLIIRGGRRTT